MAGSRLTGFVALIASGSLFLSSTAAQAADSIPSQQINPWATLTLLTGGAPAAAVCGAGAVAAAALQPTTGCVLPVMDTPPPVPPPPPAPVPPVAAAGPGYGITPLLAGLVAIAAGIGLFLLVKNHHHHNVAISPV